MRSSFTLFFIAVVLVSCDPPKSGEVFQQALNIHEELLEHEAEVRSIFDSVEQLIARDSAMAIHLPRLTALKSRLDEWDKTVVDVGSEADHADHYHLHLHSKPTEIDDAELLRLQEELLARLKLITNDVDALVEGMMRNL